MVKYHEEKAKGGWGLIITEDYIVTPEAGNCQKLLGLWDDAQIEGNKKLTEAVHKHGSKIFFVKSTILKANIALCSMESYSAKCN